MPLSLFTIIQAEDDLLGRAVEGLEQMTRTNRSTRDVMDRAQPSSSSSDNLPPSAQSAPSSTPSTTTTHSLPIRLARPDTVRRTTAPEYPRPSTSPSTTTSAGQVDLPYAHSLVHPRPRNRSPYSRSHLRSRSANTPSTSQPMMRAHSLPARTSSPSSLSPQLGGTSPLLRSPAHSGSPFRPGSPGNDYYTVPSPSFYDGGFETIAEHAELDLSASSHDRSISTLNSSRPFASRRSSGPRGSSPNRSPLTSSASSPSLLSSQGRFNEAFPSPALHHYGSTSSFSSTALSMPSTPSTNRSRSPSISSLETIEDNPEQEWEAIEADRIAKLKAAAEAEEQGEERYARRGGSLDIPARPSTGFGFSRGSAAGARKRWSVCGGERRADLDLETIWED